MDHLEEMMKTAPYFILNTFVPPRDGSRVIPAVDIDDVRKHKDKYDTLARSIGGVILNHPFVVYGLDGSLHITEFPFQEIPSNEQVEDSEMEGVRGDHSLLREISGYQLTKPLEIKVLGNRIYDSPNDRCAPRIRYDAQHTLPTIDGTGQVVQGTYKNRPEALFNLGVSLAGHRDILSTLHEARLNPTLRIQKAYLNSLLLPEPVDTR